ncbi:MAG TPA: UvrD-helicase domain-containing protein [Kofleriaceae bacterium]|nr:UvrD-helicase domain-containing protein [Kofleriaceae bacterium]
MTEPTTDGRHQAVHERVRNVIVHASAGTGKTRLLIDRWIALLAPHDGAEGIPIERMAVITFTRKAAAELRLRTRQALLAALAERALAEPRARQLRRALDRLDTAQITTIHGFADHLLRMWPAQTGLDPAYQLDDDDRGLHQACFEALVHAAETGALAPDAAETIGDLERAGLRLRSLVAEHRTYHGLDHLVADFVRQRDLAWPTPPPCDFDRATFVRAYADYQHQVAALSPRSSGSRWLLAVGARLHALEAELDPVQLFAELVDPLTRGPRGRASDKPTKKHDFTDDEAGWRAWKAFAGDDPRGPPGGRDRLLAPLRQWLAIRVIRLRPVVLQVYEQIKAQRRSVDYVDLLLQLRDLLRDHREVRAHCQGQLDHLFVDELQDTDPLQAEVIAFLCEHGSTATHWRDAALVPGKLTLVGDAKQSIYRFRRADITTYLQLIELVERSPHLTIQLTASFRTAPGLVDWINGRFAELMAAGASAHDAMQTGEVAYQPLAHGRPASPAPTVRLVPFAPPDGALSADSRRCEADTMARYLRWLVTTSTVQIADPETQIARQIGYGDIAVLALTTTTLRPLFEAFDRDDVPYAAHGGRLFLEDPLHRQFLLGLCALADRDDGVAMAAVLRPPFFALDLADLAREDAEAPEDRCTAARVLLRELRRRRFTRGAGATARALLEQTAFGRTVALGANGAQRLRGLRELCGQIEARALAEHLDFDAAIERVRAWIDDPPMIDRPLPVTGDTVRVTTVHQAKGLEFPVVVLWDTQATWQERASCDACTVARDGAQWELGLDSLRWHEPPGDALGAHERKLREAERKRLLYVAVTRTRDLLIIPDAHGGHERHVLHRLIGAEHHAAVHAEPPHTPRQPAPWFVAAAPPGRQIPREITPQDAELSEAWQTRAIEASARALVPTAFTQAATPHVWWGKRGRYGIAFGKTVHTAIGSVLTARRSVAEAVRHAARHHQLHTHHAQAEDDVGRAIETLRTLGVPAHAHQLEYPFAGPAAHEQLVAGYVDLVIEPNDREIVVIDFKTDTPPSCPSQIPQRYHDQVMGYARVLAVALPDRRLRVGLLFTADGGIRWLA